MKGLSVIEDIFRNEQIEFHKTVQSTLEKLPSRALFVVDRNIYEHWPVLRSYLKSKKVHWVDASETGKTLAEIEKIYDFLFLHQRVEPLVAIGGGITGDLAGYAAATFKRGIPLLLVPTTLLSMCDSTVGGKCGVNYKGAKNYIGAFKKPDEILISTEFLTTLPERHQRSGMGEILKYGVIGDEPILHQLMEEEVLGVFQMEKYIRMGLRIKIQVVHEDFYDQGIRNVLNFGHNIAHGLEACCQDTLTHGEAVALGLLVELRLSEDILSLDHSLRLQVKAIMAKYGMRTVLKDLDTEKLLNYIRKDKKNDDHLRFTLLRKAGCPEIKQRVEEEQILSALQEIME